MAAARPHAEAVVFRDRRLTYRALLAQVDTLARALLAAGIGRGDRVALLLPNRPEWLVTAFAVAKVGGVVVGVSTFSTPRELACTLEHAEAAALVTVEEGLERRRPYRRAFSTWAHKASHSRRAHGAKLSSWAGVRGASFANTRIASSNLRRACVSAAFSRAHLRTCRNGREASIWVKSFPGMPASTSRSLTRTALRRRSQATWA